MKLMSYQYHKCMIDHMNLRILTMEDQKLHCEVEGKMVYSSNCMTN